MNRRGENSSKQNLKGKNLMDKKIGTPHRKNSSVEITVKTKGKRGNPVPVKLKSNVNPRFSGDKKHEESEKCNWSEILGEQNKLVLKQTLKKVNNNILDDDEFDSKITSHEARKLFMEMDKANQHQQLNHPFYASNDLSPNKNHSESIFVIDKAIQCGVFDITTTERVLHETNPIKVLGNLLKKLKSLTDDERVNKILMEMGQALLRIPVETSHTEADMKAKLEAVAKSLTTTSYNVEETIKLFKNKNAFLQQHIQELSKTYKQREYNLESEIEQLKSELNEAIKTDNNNKKLINELRERNKQLELANVDLEQQNKLELDYLKLEKDKLTLLSSYKDSQIAELKNIIFESQNDIRQRIEGLIELNKKDSLNFNLNVDHSSIIQGGVAASSPKSNHSNPQFSLIKNISSLSLSPLSLNHLSNNSIVKPSSSFNSLPSSKGSSSSHHDQFYEKSHLDFTSHAGNDSFHTSNDCNCSQNANDLDLDEIFKEYSPMMI